MKPVAGIADLVAEFGDRNPVAQFGNFRSNFDEILSIFGDFLPSGGRIW